MTTALLTWCSWWNIDQAETGVDQVTTSTANVESSTEHNFTLEAWWDNWFAMYNNWKLVVEDSVSINTERSFNAETKDFTTSYPLELAFVLKDFKEDDSGLEYIGERNQQMWDGWYIMQITDSDSWETIAVSDDTMKCIVTHTAPLDTSCEKSSDSSTCGFESLEEPDNWMWTSFDDSSWDNATIHSKASVSPKDGYDDISWNNDAEFVWGPDLETNNTVLCRLTIENPNSEGASTNTNTLRTEINTQYFSKFPEVSISADDEYMYIAHETGIPNHDMMIWITNWQQQVPILQDYSGNNSWPIPLHPEFSDENLSTTENSFRWAIAVAINGIPIFTALNNRGVDSYAVWELDTFGWHSGRADDYHYHLPPVHLEETVWKDQPIAYALDGFPIYGETDTVLDEHFGIENNDGSYQYHTDLEVSPYFIPTFRGAVNYDGTEITPQARTTWVREATDPLRGELEITDFTAISDTSYSLSYIYESQIHTIDYSWDSNGEYTFVFTAPSGEITTENYSSNNNGAKQWNNQGNDQDWERPEDSGDWERPERPEDWEDSREEVESVSLSEEIDVYSSWNFVVTSSEVSQWGALPTDYTCDGSNSLLPLSWSNAPENTACYAVIMSHVSPDADIHSYMVRYNIPGSVDNLLSNSEDVWSWGTNTVNGQAEYAPPCSKWPGAKDYTYTVYALSSCDATVWKNLNREEVISSISEDILDSATLDVVYSR